MFALYELIWRRFVASQMARQRLHVRVAEIVGAKTILFVARGSKVVFDGFTKVFEVEKREDERAYLPDMKKGDTLHLAHLDASQHFTSPPPRYSEAIAHKDPRGKGDRPPFHLCRHREHHPGEGLRPQGKGESRAAAARQDGQPAPRGILPQGDRCRFYREDGRGPRPHRGGGERLGGVPDASFTASCRRRWAPPRQR